MTTKGKPIQATAIQAGSSPSAASELQERIRLRAYALWMQRECEPGRYVEHWLQAELELSGTPSENANRE